jgi:hypothetical protein
MKKMFHGFIGASALILISAQAVATPYSVYGLGHTVPTTSNHITLDSPQQGELVLDTGGTTPGFFGFDGASWQQFANSPTASVDKMANIGLAAATASVTNDSIKITGATASLSAGNPGYVRVPNTSGGFTSFTVTSDITITPTSAGFGQSGHGDVTGAILRVIALNDAGTLKWGVIFQGGRKIIKSANAFTAAASVVDPEDALVNSSLGGTSGFLDIGWVRVDFTDSTTRWVVESGAGSINVGISADGFWQPFGLSVTGCSGTPTVPSLEWTMIGESVEIRPNFSCTSNATSFNFIAPVKDGSNYDASNVPVEDGGTVLNAPGLVAPHALGSRTMDVYRQNSSGLNGWTATGVKALQGGAVIYKVSQP